VINSKSCAKKGAACTTTTLVWKRERSSSCSCVCGWPTECRTPSKSCDIFPQKKDTCTSTVGISRRLQSAGQACVSERGKRGLSRANAQRLKTTHSLPGREESRS
jgi:hypothetical protein